MKTQLLALVAFITLAFTACTKGELNDPRSVDITGEWRWVKSVGGIAGLTLTPESTGNHFKQVFGTDNTFKLYRNDTLTTQDRFSITKNYKYGDEYINVLQIGNSKDSFFIRNDSLYTSQLFISDGYGSVYVKIK